MGISGKESGAANVARLSAYVDGLKAANQPLPRKRNGGINVSAIAFACGFDRGVLYQNPGCRKLIEAAITELPASSDSAARPASLRADPRDKRIRELEHKNANLQELLSDMQVKLQKAEQYQRLYEHAIETGRDIIP